MSRATTTRRVLPGFHLALGYTLFYLALIVLVPLGTLLWKSTSLGPSTLWELVTSERALASYGLTFGASAAAAAINAVFGFVVAWVLVRYPFPGSKILDSLVDLPFALPTAVSGIALMAVFSKGGWLGSVLEPLGIKVVFQPLGIVLALTFIGLPFVVRTVQPVLQELEADLEEAAAVLGADRWTVFWRVILPNLLPALVTGFALAFARAIGEYGSVVFISGNMPMKTEIAPLLIMTRLEQYDYAGATALALVLLVVSLVLLLAINRLQAWTQHRSVPV